VAHILLHLSGELSLKGREPRKKLTDRLTHNLADALKSHGCAYRLERRWSHLVIHSDSPEAPEIAARVFGIKSVAVAERRPWTDLEDLLRQGQEIFTPEVRGRTFAVRARRGEEATRIPFRSPELERRLGALLVSESAGVDLGNPQVEARIELQGQQAYFFGRRRPAEGGLPVGTSGRALALVSGGFDSLVAAWQMLRRGIRLDFCCFDLGGHQHRVDALRAIVQLVDRWCYGYRPRLHLVDFRPVADELRERTDQRLWQVILKRQMLRAASSLCRHSKAQALVTGECLSQVSSQTMTNLLVLDRTVERSILRPLLTWNKEDIIALARHVGTHDASARVAEFCALDGKGPETHADLGKVEAEEEALDPHLLDRILGERTIVELRDPDLAAWLAGPAPATPLAVEAIPEDAVLLDLRSERAFDGWHPANAVHASYPAILREFRQLEPSRTYVAYCEVSLKSSHLAEVMAGAGYRAHFVEGGSRALIRESMDRDPLLLSALSPASITAPDRTDPKISADEDRESTDFERPDHIE
jgi:thiamine biosynthesis protein ThiI